MAYPTPNYTQCPNLLLDEHLPDMGYAECKIVLAICRKTFGWHKQRDRLSISQLMELTGLSNRSVIDGVRKAMDRGVVQRAKSGDSYEYWLVVGSEVSSQQGVKQVHRGSEVSSQQGVKQVHTQKKHKETLTKESAREREDNLSPERESDPPAVRIWNEVTGQRPNIATLQTLKSWLTANNAPPWNAGVFRNTLEQAYLNVDRKTHRIRVGYLKDSYEKKLDYSQRQQKRNGTKPDLTRKRYN